MPSKRSIGILILVNYETPFRTCFADWRKSACGENENQYLLRELELWVCQKVSSKIFVRFFTICNTHEDIEQTNSGTSPHLKPNDAVTRFELHKELCSNYNELNAVTAMTSVINISGRLNPKVAFHVTCLQSWTSYSFPFYYWICNGRVQSGVNNRQWLDIAAP